MKSHMLRALAIGLIFLSARSSYALNGYLMMALIDIEIRLAEDDYQEAKDKFEEDHPWATYSEFSPSAATWAAKISQAWLVGLIGIPSDQHILPGLRQAESQFGEIRGTTQPTDAHRVILGYRPVAFLNYPAGSQRTYILNTALKQILPGSPTPVDAPNFVDFLDDLTYEARIDLNRGDTAYFEPQDMALSQDGRRIVVAARGSDKQFFPNNAVPPHLAIINTATATFEKRIVFADTFWPTSVVLSPDGQTAYVGMTIVNGTQITGQQAVVIVDIASGQTTGRIDLPSGGRTGEMAITPDGALLFILANLDSSRLYEIDVRSRTVAAEITGSPVLRPNVRALGESTELVANPQGTKLYLIDAAAPQSSTDAVTVGVGVVDVATATLTNLVPIAGTTRRGSGDDVGTALGGRVIVALDGVNGLLTFLDAATLETIAQKDLGDNLFEAALSEGP